MIIVNEWFPSGKRQIFLITGLIQLWWYQIDFPEQKMIKWSWQIPLLNQLSSLFFASSISHGNNKKNLKNIFLTENDVINNINTKTLLIFIFIRIVIH